MYSSGVNPTAHTSISLTIYENIDDLVCRDDFAGFDLEQHVSRLARLIGDESEESQIYALTILAKVEP